MILNIVSTSILGISILIGWLSYTRYLRYRLRIDTLNERLNIILDKLGDQQELLDFLESTHGQLFLNNLTASGTSTKIPILIMLSSGIVSLFVGIGAWGLTIYIEDDFIFGAVFMSTLGLGFLFAAGITYLLSRVWNILDSGESYPPLINSMSPESVNPESVHDAK